MIVVEIADVPNAPCHAVARPLGYAQPINDLARSIPGLYWDQELRGYAGWPDAVAAFAFALDKEKLAAVVGTIQDPADRLDAIGKAKGGRGKVLGSGPRSNGGSPPGRRSAGSSIVPTEARPYQREGIEFMRLLAPEGGALLAWDVGLGKQQPIDTNVLTPSGWQKIGTIRAGDRVIGSDGRPVAVRSVHPQGKKPSYRVTFSDHSSVEAGPEHLWTVLYRYDGRRWAEMVLTTERLQKRGVVEVERGGVVRHLDITNERLYLPILSAPAEFDSEPLPVTPYLLGALIANASLSWGTPQLVVGAIDWPEIKKALESENAPIGSVRTYGTTVHASFLNMVGSIHALGLDVLSRDKRIPSIYLRARPEDRISLLHGLMDGDGSISSKQNRVTYHTICEGLANDVRELVEGLGGIASVRAYDRSEEEKPIDYQVRLRLPPSILPFRLSRKRDRYKPGSHALPRRTVTSVEYVRDVESICIVVDAPDRLYATEHAILTHNTMGVLTAMRTMIECDGLPKVAVVIGPSVTKPIWAAESTKWHPGVFRPIILEGTKGIEKSGFPFLRDLLASNVPGIPLVILNYDIAHAWVGTLSHFRIGVLACDEAHFLQEPRSRRSRAVRDIRSRASAVIMLSGTPMQTRPKDLWNVLDTMAPGRFGVGKDGKPDPWMTYRRYCNAHKETIAQDTTVWNVNGSSNEDELNLRLRWIMTRKSKADVLTDLPPRIRQTVPIDIPGRFILPIWESGDKMRRDALSEALSMSGIGKAGAASDLTASRIAEGHSVLIFTHRRETAKRLYHGEKKDKLIGVSGLVPPNASALITGDVSLAERKKGIDRLRAIARGGKPVVIVATIDSIGVGVDISYCDVVIFNDLSWVPSRLLQAEGRAHRHGNVAESVLVYYLIGVGTADEYIQKKVIERLDLYEKVIGGQAEGKELKEDLERMNVMSEAEVLADLKRAVLAGEVVPEEDEL